MEKILEITNLMVSYEVDGRHQKVVDKVSLFALKSEFTVLLGETGSGKSTIAKAIINLLPQNALIDPQSQVVFDGVDVTRCSDKQIQKIRKDRIAVIPQNPLLASNPSRTCGNQLKEVLKMHRKETSLQLEKEVLGLLAEVGIDQPERIANSYPHQVSLGQLQRTFIAMALAAGADFIIADEPFSSVDIETRDLLIEIFQKVQKEQLVSIFLITHDLSLIDRLADQWYVLFEGRMIAGGREGIFDSQSDHPYVRSLISGYREVEEESRVADSKVLLEVEHLSYAYRTTSGRNWFKATSVPVLHNVSLKIFTGDTLGLVGKSGSGKSTLSRIVGGILQAEGMVRWRGESIKDKLNHYPKKYYKDVQYLLQDSATALPPRRLVGRILGETLLAFGTGSRKDIKQKVEQLLKDVYLPESFVHKNRSQLSGGEKQRVCLARALAAEPSLLILDESLASLDKSVQREILELLQEIREKRSLTIILVSHDLELVRHFCNRIVMMQDGRLIEENGKDRKVVKGAG